MRPPHASRYIHVRWIPTMEWRCAAHICIRQEHAISSKRGAYSKIYILQHTLTLDYGG